jgi:hypothetical protein
MEVKILHHDAVELEHRGVNFKVYINWTEDGRVTFTPEWGWNDLSVAVDQDSESLLEEIDDAIYNALPELWEGSDR